MAQNLLGQVLSQRLAFTATEPHTVDADVFDNPPTPIRELLTRARFHQGFALRSELEDVLEGKVVEVEEDVEVCRCHREEAVPFDMAL